jgi:sugar phosphate isomerase/epimerase
MNPSPGPSPASLERGVLNDHGSPVLPAPRAAGGGPGGGVPLALSTMWAQQGRFQGDFRRFAEVARAAGFTAVEISHSTDEAGLRECLTSGVLPVVSLHAPTPFRRAKNGRANSALNLAALDEFERREAVDATRLTIEFAAEHGVRAVVVHLGGVDGGPRAAERRLRELFAADAIDGEEAARLRAEGIAARAAAAPAHIEAARRSLGELVAYARPRAVALGLENRLHYHEIPSPEEALDLLADYAPDEAGYWHDTGHAEVWSRLGFTPHQRFFDLLRGRLIGCHLHDVRGLLDHRAPGNGTLDWAMVRAGIPVTAARTCEIDQHEPEALLSSSVRLLEEYGIAVAAVAAPTDGGDGGDSG